MKEYKNYEPRQGLTLREIICIADNVYIETADGDLYRFWVGYDGMPRIELIERG